MTLSGVGGTGTDPTPEQLLGLPVLAPGGGRLGVIVDVGLAAWNQPKFLLVQPSQGRLVRVDIGQVREVGQDAVRLAVPVNPQRLPP